MTTSAVTTKPLLGKATRTSVAPGGPRPESRPKTSAAPMSASDLAELLTTFNETTGRLQAAHEKLTAEVARLEKELRGANRQLRRARQLAALGEMAAGIAHEVRNPLGSIKLYAKVLCEDLASMPEQAGVAGKIMGAVDRLNAVVGDVLSFSRELTPRAAEITAWEIIEPALEASREVASRLGVEITFDRAALEAVHLNADASLLSLAATNVVRNACEAVGEFDAPRGTTQRRVEVRAERRRVVIASDAKAGASGERRDAVAIIVTDTGPGVPEEALARVFNPFFTTRHTGTGLGLAIVHRVMDAHGGSVSIRNNAPDPGATVELIVPEASSNETDE